MYLETSSLFLRQLTIDDLDHIYSLFSDKGAMLFSGNQKKPEKYLENIQNSYKENGYGLYGVFLKENEAFIGLCGLLKQEINHKTYAEVSYRLKQEYWNKGYATQAAIAVKNYAFEKLHVNELISIIEKTNMRSMAVSKKVGLSHKFDYCFKGFDSYIFSIKKT